MNTLLSEDELEQVTYVESVGKRNLAEFVPTHAPLMQKLIAEGRISICGASHSMIAVSALNLTQIAWVIHGNLQQARQYLAVPLSSDLEPNFGALAKLLDEGIRGLRRWDGEKMSLLQQPEHLLCYLLLNRTTEIAMEYAAFRQAELFHKHDIYSWRAIFARHLILASQGCYEELRIEDYAKLDPKMKKSDFLFVAHTALVALAQGDEAKFAQEMAACCEAFKKRKKSRLLASTWGYGIASHFCFDVVGTALYRLAVQRGLNFPQPEQRYYPVEFWQQ